MSRDFFATGFFHESPSSKPLIITFGSFRAFSKIRGDIRKSRCTTGDNDTGGKFATGVNNTGGKLPPVSTTPAANWPRYQRHPRQILPPVPLVLLTPAANLPPVSTTLVANCHRYQRHRRQICHRCHWHRWQIIATISGCRHLKVNLKAKLFYMFPLLPKGDQIKLLKFFWLKIFFICHRCRWHRWQTLSCEYLREFLKKFETVLMEYSGAGGNWFMKRTRSKKSRDTVPLKELCKNTLKKLISQKTT